MVWIFSGGCCMYLLSVPLLELFSSVSVYWRREGEVSLRFSSTVTLSIGSTSCNFFISLAEISVSLWSSSPEPENDADAGEAFEVTNHTSPRAVIRQFELWSLARRDTPSLLFLRYVQTTEPLVVECFFKCQTCVRHVRLGLSRVCISAFLQADPAYTERQHSSGRRASGALAGQCSKQNNFPNSIASGHASESFSTQDHHAAGILKLNFDKN